MPLGKYAELTARGIPRTGTETFGGSIVTAGGLVFIAGTKDEKFRAFDKRTGRLLWEHALPAGGTTTPATHRARRRQYLDAAGGACKLKTRAGDAFVAFRLPDCVPWRGRRIDRRGGGHDNPHRETPGGAFTSLGACLELPGCSPRTW